MRKIIIILFLFQASPAFAQKNSTMLVNNIINQIANRNVYELSNTIGFSGKPSQQLILLDSLMANSTIENLLNNAQYHTSAVVRLYCYKALLLNSIIMPAFLKKQLTKIN